LKDQAPLVITGRRDFASAPRNPYKEKHLYSVRDMSEDEFLDFSDNGSD
jgi:hypothetical protein